LDEYGAASISEFKTSSFVTTSARMKLHIYKAICTSITSASYSFAKR
jgi:hypothetical protein